MVAVRAVEDARPREVWPEMVNAVAEAVASVVCPVTTAFVVVEFPITMLVKLARVASNEEKKPLVLVLLVE